MEQITAPKDEGTHVIALRSLQMIFDPTRPGRFLYGPCRLEWTVHPDHGIEVKVLEGNPQ
jgi:hypothetical protein